MKIKYRVKRYWELCDEVEVEVVEGEESLVAEKAMELPLTEGRYVPDSINVDEELDVIKL